MVDPTQYSLWNSGVPRPYLRALASDDFLTEGKGVRICDAAGRWYLDARSGLWNVTLGYSNDRVKKAIKDQLDRLPFANIYGYGRPHQGAHDYANALVRRLPDGINWVRFNSNGAQAVETAILLSRFLRRAAGRPERQAVFSMWEGFHGLGPGAGAVTGMPYLHHQTGPLLPDVHHAPGPFAPIGPGSDLERLITDYGPDRVTAVIVEPVVGEGGHVLSADYLASLARFCREHDIHLIFDEIVTGMGRVGDYTRAGQLGVVPDMITLGKGITSGYVPMSAVAVHERVYAALRDHTSAERALGLGSTNDGHALATAAASAVLEVLEEEQIFDNVRRRSEQLRAGLEALRDKHPELKHVRGTGLIQGLEFGDADGAPWSISQANRLRIAVEARGVLVSSLRAAPQIMLVPPLVITSEDVEEIVAALDGAIVDVREGRRPAKGYARAMG